MKLVEIELLFCLFALAVIQRFFFFLYLSCDGFLSISVKSYTHLKDYKEH